MQPARTVAATGLARLSVRSAGDETEVMDVLSVALTGMQGAETRLAVSAHNVANLLTGDFRPLRATQSTAPGGGSQVRVDPSASPGRTSLVRETVDQMLASTQYTASARVFAVGAEMRGQLVDLLA